MLVSTVLVLTPGASRLPTDVQEVKNRSAALVDVREEIDWMLAHLNEALFALSGNDLRAADAQFGRFMSVWQLSKVRLGAIYPDDCRLIEDLLQLSGSGAHPSLPQDVPAARTTLRSLRASLLVIAQDLKDRETRE